MLQCVLICINFILLKQRKNPFNNEIIGSHTFEEKDRQLLDAAVDQTQTPNEGESTSVCAILFMYGECEWSTLSMWSNDISCVMFLTEWTAWWANRESSYITNQCKSSSRYSGVWVLYASAVSTIPVNSMLAWALFAWQWKACTGLSLF